MPQYLHHNPLRSNGTTAKLSVKTISCLSLNALYEGEPTSTLESLLTICKDFPGHNDIWERAGSDTHP